MHERKPNLEVKIPTANNDSNNVPRSALLRFNKHSMGSSSSPTSAIHDYLKEKVRARKEKRLNSPLTQQMSPRINKNDSKSYINLALIHSKNILDNTSALIDYRMIEAEKARASYDEYVKNKE